MKNNFVYKVILFMSFTVAASSSGGVAEAQSEFILKENQQIDTINHKMNIDNYINDTRIPVISPECDPAFSPIGRVEVTFPDGFRGRGTGFLIANDLVVTAAHVLYSNEHGGSAQRVEFVPSAGENGYEPFCRADGLGIRIPLQYISGGSNSFLYDYAMFEIDQPLGADARANHFDLRMASPDEVFHSYVSVTGYPLIAQEHPRNSMWTASGGAWLTNEGARLTYYLTASPGESGAPIVLNDDPRYVIGIHTEGPSDAADGNSGVFITQDVYDFLTY